MNKRKNDEIHILNPIGMVLLALGLIALIAISVFALWNYFRHPVNSGPAVRSEPTTGDPMAIAIDANKHLPTVTIPDNARLMLSTRAGEILTFDGANFSATGLHGNEVSVAPDGKRFVYWRGPNLFLYHDGEEDKFNLTAQEGVLGRFTWSADGGTLLFVVSGLDFYVNRVRLADSVESAHPQQMASFSALDGPAIIEPKTGLVLVALNGGPNKTTLYSLNLFCPIDDCMSSLKQLGTIPFNVNWITYQKDSIAFSEDVGNIYQFALETGELTPLVMNSEHKTRPTFSPDGQHLAYLGAQHQLVILRMSDKQIESVAGYDIAALN